MSEKSKSNFEAESPQPLIETSKTKKSIFGLSALLNLLGKLKFLNNFYRDEKGKTDWLKILRNILLMYIGIYYLGILRDTFNNNTERGLFFGGSIDGLVMLGYLILCIILFLPIIFFTTYFGKYGKIIAFCFFMFLIGIYIHNISYCINPVCLLNPIIFFTVNSFFHFNI